MENTQNIRPFGMRDKIGYAFGDMGCNFSFQLVTAYMYLFYTQCIGLSAANWAWIIVVSKVWDAINDILIGNMVDRKRIGKSKFMPWIAIGSVALVVTSIMIFTPVTGFSQSGKIAWCLGSYCLWSVAYTLINVPYGSLHSVITDDPKQRTTLSTFRSIGASLPAVLIMILPKVVYKDNVLDANRLFVITIIFSICAFIVFFAMRKMVTERVVREEAPQAQKVSYISTLKSFFSNRAIVAITIATVAVVIFYNSTMSVNNLVFQFYFNDASKATLAMIASYIPLVGFMPFASSIVAKIGKKKLISISGAISVFAGIIMLFLPITPDSKGILLYVIGLMIVNVGCCVFQIIVWAIIADCIEMSYRKKGVREEASLYALYSFFRKLSQGIGSAIVALALSKVGYIESATTQTPQASENIKNLYIIFLIIGLAVMTLSMWFIYNIDYKQEQAFAQSSHKNEE